MNGAASSTHRQSGAAIDNRRAAPRHPCSDPIWWKASGQGSFQHGWLIERSRGGVAFLVRGDVELSDGQELEVSTSTPTDVGFHLERGTVARVTHVHADLYLVAAELRPA